MPLQREYRHTAIELETIVSMSWCRYMYRNMTACKRIISMRRTRFSGKLSAMNLKFAIGAAAIAFLAGRAAAQEPAFPLADVVTEGRQAAVSAHSVHSGLGREDYLKTSEGIVLFFQHFQAADGRIIDPLLRREIQYSTPCYACAASALISGGRQTNLLDSAARALDVALEELSTGHAADNHTDFFTFPCMLAYESLRDRVSSERRARWESDLRADRARNCVYQDLPEQARAA